jgi:Protein of unknown function (DUF2905)
MGRALIIAGAVLLALGLLVQLAPHAGWLGRLPGDLRIERPGFRLYVPITTSILVSLVLTALLHLIGRLR